MVDRVDRIATAAASDLRSLVRVGLGYRMTSFRYLFMVTVAAKWATAMATPTMGLCIRLKVEKYHLQVLSTGCKCCREICVLPTVVEVSPISHRWWKSAALSTILANGTIIHVLDSPDWAIASTSALIWMRLRNLSLWTLWGHNKIGPFCPALVQRLERGRFDTNTYLETTCFYCILKCCLDMLNEI